MFLSACIITYNQEDYIKDCLDGAINQNVDFEYEIVIGDDCSNDRTSEICREYAIKYPNLIKYIKRNKNLGMNGNWAETISICKGKYIALCEGDDYWTDPLKLQKQVDFFEANPDYNICFHEVDIFNQSKNEIERNNITRNVPETTDISDLAKGNYIHTPSVLLRNDFILPDWFSKTPMGDWSVYMIVAKDKKIKKFDEVMAVYRVHNNSIWATKPKVYRIVNTIKSIELLINAKETPLNVKKILKQNVNNLKSQLPEKYNRLMVVLKKIKRKYYG